MQTCRRICRRLTGANSPKQTFKQTWSRQAHMSSGRTSGDIMGCRLSTRQIELAAS